MSMKNDLKRLSQEATTNFCKFALKWEPYDAQRLVVMASTVFLVLFGGNQCLAGEQEVFDPVTGKRMRVDAIDGDFHVEAWDGRRVVHAKACRPYIKEAARIYRVVYDDGTEIRASEKHLVLTPSGWQPISEVLVRWPDGFDVCLPESTSECDLSARLEDVLRWTHKVQGSQSGCPACRHSGDGRPRSGEEGVPGVPTSRDGAPGRRSAGHAPHAFGPSGARGGRPAGNHAYPGGPQELPLVLVPVDGFGPHGAGTASIHAGDLSRALSQSRDGEGHPGSSSRDAERQWEWACAALKAGLSAPELRTKRVVQIDYLRTDTIWDFEVPGYANYILDGTINHNSGKTWTGLHKVRYDATGEYPEWWEGKRSHRGLDIWVCGDRYTSIRDGIQVKLFGRDLKNPGSEMNGDVPPLFPSELVLDWAMAPNGDGALAWVKVKHIPSGGITTITFKTYHQGIDGLASATIDLAHVDEECSFDVLQEIVMRVMVREGQIICTMTPLKGRSAFYKFLSRLPVEYGTIAYLGWYQALHLSSTMKSAIMTSFAGQGQMEARTTGHPVVATGICFPYMFEDLMVDPFPIPDHWPRITGCDHGWTTYTTGLTLVSQPMSPVWYCLPPYIGKQREPREHHTQLMEKFGDTVCAMDWSTNQQDKGTGFIPLEGFNIAYHGKGYERRVLPEFQKYRKAMTRDWGAGYNSVDKLLRDGNLYFVKDTGAVSLGKRGKTPMEELVDQLEEMEWDEAGEVAKNRNSLHLFDGLRYAAVSKEWAQPIHRPRPSMPPRTRTIDVPEWSRPAGNLR